MAKNRRIPAYCLHKPTGQARVRIAGKDHYLGKFGSPESHDKYDELISEFLIDAEPSSSTTLTALLAAWWPECKRRYSQGKGKLGGAQNWRPVIRLLREKHGEERAEDLGPKKLRTLLESAAKEHDWSLRYARMQLQRVKTIFEWAIAEEHIQNVQVLQRLKTCKLRHGRETQPILPVSDELIQQTLPHLSLQVADMVRIQRLTGMRPGELVIMRKQDIDRSSDVWIYTPQSHKNKHRGKDRSIFIGPRAQAILAQYILKAEGFLFPSGRAERYTPDSYRRAVHRACERHKLTKWSPHQLRKAAATQVRSALDVESAASLLGHSSPTVTANHYASADRERAIEAAKLLG